MNSKKNKYVSAFFHLHSIFEGSMASMSGYCYEASRFGVDVIWIAEHDQQYFRKKSYQFNLEGNYNFKSLNAPKYCSVRKNNKSIIMKIIAANKEWQGVVLELPNPNNNVSHTVFNPMRVPLITYPVFKLKLEPDSSFSRKDNRIIVRCYLSQIPPNHKQIVLDYYYGAPLKHNRVIPLQLDQNQVILDIFKDCQRLGLNGDHNLNKIEVILQACNNDTTSISIKEVSYYTKIWGIEDLYAAHQQLGNKLGQKYGVKVLINCEAAGKESHMTVFGSNISIKNLRDFKHGDGLLNCSDISNYANKEGGLSSVNHPFIKWKEKELKVKEKDLIVEKRAQELIRCKNYGAYLLEVGFPEGRHGFSPKHYLRLWDLLNLNGLKVYGIGASDAHLNYSWEKGNNFANYMLSPDSKVDNLVVALKKGYFYMADPVRVKGELFFETELGKTMGDKQKSGELVFAIDKIPVGSKFTWVADGKVIKNEITNGSHRSLFDLSKAKYFVRGELQDTYGRYLLLTNPIWI